MKHIKQLDSLRFIAVFLVLVEHFATTIGQYFSAGYYGVDLFFVISGFLITTILLKNKEPFGNAYKKFLGRRTLRIFPIYYLTILILYIIGNEYVHRYLIYCLTYTYNYIYFDVPVNPISHFWSLGVEEQFYLFWPFLILSLRNNLKLLTYLVFLLVLICTIQQQFQIFPSIPPLGLIPQANALGIGGLGAIYFNQNKIPSKTLTDKRVEYLAIFILAFFLFTNFSFKYIACPIISLFLILKTAYNGFSIVWFNNFLNNKHIIYIGSISYGIYLFHLPLGHYITEYLFDPYFWKRIPWHSLGVFEKMQYNTWIIKLPLYSFLSILVAHFSYKYVENPILSLKDKLFKYK